MKKYQVRITYNGDITLEILADSKEQARFFADEEINNMNDKEYLEHLNLEIDNAEITEI